MYPHTCCSAPQTALNPHGFMLGSGEPTAAVGLRDGDGQKSLKKKKNVFVTEHLTACQAVTT